MALNKGYNVLLVVIFPFVMADLDKLNYKEIKPAIMKVKIKVY